MSNYKVSFKDNNQPNKNDAKFREEFKNKIFP